MTLMAVQPPGDSSTKAPSASVVVSRRPRVRRGRAVEAAHAQAAHSDPPGRGDAPAVR
jgi:hypothetical protein